jgi:hypothetical protein
MPKIAVRTEDRVRIEVEYDDYKDWEELLGNKVEEHTTMVDPNEPNSGWWKTLFFKIGKTEYRISGPLMRSRED